MGIKYNIKIFGKAVATWGKAAGEMCLRDDG
jgi:hypothetical protein